MADGRVEDEIIFSRAKNKNCPAENSTEQFFVFGNDTKDAEIFHSPRNLYQRTQNFFIVCGIDHKNIRFFSFGKAALKMAK